VLDARNRGITIYCGQSLNGDTFNLIINRLTKALRTGTGEVFGAVSINILSMAFGLIQVVAISRWLGSEGRGILSSVFVVPSLISQIMEWGQLKTINHALGKSLYPENLVSRLTIIFALTAGVVGTILSILIEVHLGADWPKNIVMAASSVVFVQVGFQLLRGFLLGKNLIWHHSYVLLINIAVVSVGTLLAAMILSSTVLVLWSRFVGYATAIAIGLVFLSKRITRKKHLFSINVAKYFLTQGFLYTSGMFTIALLFRIDVLILSYFVSESQVGIYVNGMIFSEVIRSLAATVGVVIMAKVSRADDYILFARRTGISIVHYTLITSAILSVLMYIFANMVINTLFGKEFAESSNIVKILLPGTILLSAGIVIQTEYDGRGRPLVTIIAFGVSSLFNIVLNVVFVPLWGIYGAAWICTFSYSLCAIMLIGFYLFENKIDFFRIFLNATDKTK
jgi:O-antigen/teichoic acid export membrane protein